MVATNSDTSGKIIMCQLFDWRRTDEVVRALQSQGIAAIMDEYQDGDTREVPAWLNDRRYSYLIYVPVNDCEKAFRMSMNVLEMDVEEVERISRKPKMW